MKSLNQIRYTLASAAAFGALAVTAAPLASIGDNTSLFINSAIGVDYNSNIFRSTNNRESETALFVRPGVELTYGGQGAPASATLLAAVEFRRHDHFDELDGEYARINFDTTYDSGVTLFTGHISYNEFSSSSQEFDALLTPVGVAVEQAEGRARGNVKYRISDRLAIGGGAGYHSTTYQNTPAGRTLVNLERYELPIRLFYNIAPRLDAVVGYRFRDVRIGDAPVGSSHSDYRDHYFFVGFDGELFNPLWHGSFDIGFQERSYRGVSRDSVDSISANGRITYQADENRSYYLLLTRDYFVSPVGAATFLKNQITLGANYRLTEMWSFIAAANYATTRYEGANRKEDLFFILAGVSYSPNEYFSLNANVRLTTVDGSGADGRGNRALEYDNEFVSISASVRY